jgi:hypothetical protein
MRIDPKAVGLKGGPVRRSWTSKDALLYALGVGAGIRIRRPRRRATALLKLPLRRLRRNPHVAASGAA